MKNTKIYKFIISILICEVAGIIGSFFTTPAIEGWYKDLNKPLFNPPNWIFAPVWTLLYLLMGISLYLIWTKEIRVGKEIREKTIALIIFEVQLILNIAWSFLFFGLKNPLLAFAGIIILWISILLSIIHFYKIDKRAAYILIPYILWVSFAAVLNFSLWRLNI